MRAGASSVSQPLKMEGKTVVAVGLTDQSGITLVSLNSGEVEERLSVSSLALQTDSGNQVQASVLVLGHKADSAQYRCSALPLAMLSSWQ